MSRASSVVLFPSLFLHPHLLSIFIHAIREQARNFARTSPPPPPASNLHNEQSRGDLNFESEEQTPCITQTKLLDESVNMAEVGASASKFVINLNSAAVYISSGARWPLIEIIFLAKGRERQWFLFLFIYLFFR